jgi:hypothetical protein
VLKACDMFTFHSSTHFLPVACIKKFTHILVDFVLNVLSKERKRKIKKHLRMYRKQENKESSKDRIISNKWFCYITVDSETHIHQKII